MAYIAHIGGREVRVDVTRDGQNRLAVTVEDRGYIVDALWTQADLLSLLINGCSYQVDIHTQRDRHEVLVDGEHFEFDLFDERKAFLKKEAGLGSEGVQEVRTSMPGRIIRVMAGPGEGVEKGQGLVVIEAMKMENEIRSPKDGVVKKVGVREGDVVEAGALLVVVE